MIHIHKSSIRSLTSSCLRSTSSSSSSSSSRSSSSSSNSLNRLNREEVVSSSCCVNDNYLRRSSSVRNYSSNAFSSGSLNTVADSDSDSDDVGVDDTDDDSDDDDDDDDDDSDGDYVNYGNKADTNAAEIAEESGPGNGMLLTIIHDITIHYFTSTDVSL